MLLIMKKKNKRNPKYKELNFDTAMRNPERLKDVLLLIKPYENSELTDNILLEIVGKMYVGGLVGSKDFDLKKLKNDKEIKDKVIEINKSRNSDGGFPKGYQSRFWTYMRTLSEFGFVYARYNKKLILGDIAKKLINDEIDSQEAFAIQSMKYNWKSPYRNVSNDYNYFIFIIKVLRELNKQNRKLNYYQFVISLFSKEDNVDEFLNVISNHQFLDDVSVYDYLTNAYGKQNKITTVLRDYPDTVLRMLRLTGFINIINNGILLIELNNDTSKIVDYFIKNEYVFTEEEKSIDYEYFKKINVLTIDEMKIIKNSRNMNVIIDDYNFVLKEIVKNYKFDRNKILSCILNIGKKGKNLEFKYIDQPLQFEFYLSVLLYLIYGDSYSVRPNYKTDSYGMPISHAPGNCGDIEIVGKGKYWLVEATLIRNKGQQLNNETTNLFRHLSKQEWGEMYMSLVAPVVHDDTYRLFNALIIDYINESKNNFNAKCYCTEEFLDKITSKKIFEDMKDYTKEYKDKLLASLNK